MNKKIGIIGSSGLIGTALKDKLRKYELVEIPGHSLYSSHQLIADKINGLDVIINLAGHSINGRWTSKRKMLIYKSRIELTNNLVQAISLLDHKPSHLINASAVGIYEDGNEHDENSFEYADNPLAKIVIEWESAAKKVSDFNVNLTIMRLGVVFSREGGAYPVTRRIFKLGIGGKIGNGKQGFSFILINDLINAIEFIIDKKIYGVINIVCPEPINNFEFTKEVAFKLNRPAIFTKPSFLIKCLFSSGSVFLLKGQKVLPGKLINQNFKFVGNNLKTCLDILEK